MDTIDRIETRPLAYAPVTTHIDVRDKKKSAQFLSALSVMSSLVIPSRALGDFD